MKKKKTFPSCRLIVSLICLFLLVTFSSFKAMANDISDTLLANSYFENAKAYADLGQSDSAIFYYGSSANIYKQFDMHQKYASCLNHLSEVYFYLGKLESAKTNALTALHCGMANELNHEIGKSYNIIAAIFNQRGNVDSASFYFEKVLSVWLPLDGEQHVRIVIIYTNLGAMYQILGDYQKSLEYSMRAIEIVKLLDDGSDEYLAYNYNTLGTISVAKGLNAEAIFYFEEALRLWIAKYGKNHTAISAFYMNIAEIYRRKGDFEQALLYNDKALIIFDSLGIRLHQYVGTCYSNNGTIYTEIRDFDNALIAYKEAGEIWASMDGQHYNLATINNNISNIYLKTKSYDTAIIYIDKAIDILKTSFQVDRPELGLYYINMGKNFFFKKDYGNAKAYFDKAIETTKNVFTDKHPNKVLCYMAYGQLYMAQQQNRKALAYLQKAIIADIQGFDNDDVFANPVLNNILSKTHLVSALENKARAFDNLFHEMPDSLIFIETALKTSSLAINLLDIIRTEHKSDGSKFFLNKEYASVFEDALNYSIELYEITGDQKYLQKAFGIAEKGKSAVLFASLIELGATTIGGIPDSLQKMARILKHDIDFYDQKIKEENKKGSPDIGKLGKWRDFHFDCVKGYDELIVSFEKEFPEYHDLKYNLDVANMNNVRSNLQHDDALIEYVLTDTAIVAFVITNNGSDIFTVSIDNGFSRQLDEFRELIISKDLSEGAINRYCAVAHNLYLKLISPMEKLLEGSALIIVPDGKLATIPFEALLSSPVKGGRVNMKNLPFLIRQYPVSYAYSATILLNSMSKRNCAVHNSILSFAPSFRSDNNTLLAELKERGAEFVSLAGTKDEVVQINTFAPGELYLDNNASEANFKQQAPTYQVLHVATHGIIDDKKPMMSRLAFSTDNDSVEDGSLYVYELYGLRLNADMAVLSACNTGSGKLQEGEGVMSMARAFLYAGVPSIVMSQWSVNDQSSTKIMVSFYEGLGTGLSKARALQEAKVNYLQNADNITAHPYFWAAFVIIGNPAHVGFSSGEWYWWLLIVPVLLLGWLLFRKIFSGRF